MAKGLIKWCPKDFIDELNDVKITFKVLKDSDAFKIIAQNSRIAREIKFNLNYKYNRR